MQEPSIRSFTLDYYRSMGAQLTPLDDDSRRWEIRLPARQEGGRTMQVSFDPKAAREGTEVVTRATAAWREMLERVLEERPVSHRHLVTQPIDQVAEHLRAMLPGFGITRAALVSVRPRIAVGFTHRVVYDAPALSGRIEELHHDLVDARSGERLDGLSEDFYGMPSIPIEPAEDPRMLPVEHLRGRALHRLELLSAPRAGELELELESRLQEAAAQLHRYYEDRAALLRADEVRALEERLAALAGRIEATSLDGAIASLRREAAAVAVQLEHLDIQRALEAETLYAEREQRIDAERVRHELSLETSLISLAYVTFDEVQYALELAEGSLEVIYVPVTGELRMPPCPACQRAFAVGSDAPPPGRQGARVVCHRCAPEPGPERHELPLRAAEPCVRCGVMTPLATVARCHLSEAPHCVVCALRCQACGKVTSRELLRPNPAGRGMICPDHALPCATCQGSVLARESFTCPGCAARHCRSHAEACPSCGMPSCASCARAGHCKACRTLGRVGPDHDLVRVVRGLYPELGGWGMQWRLAEVGDLALVEWTAPMGHGGRIVLVTDDYHVLATRRRRPFGSWA